MSTVKAMSISITMEQWIVVVAEEDRANHGRTTLRNGWASRCRDCCAQQTIEVDEQPLHGRHLSKYTNDVWASQELVSSEIIMLRDHP